MVTIIEVKLSRWLTCRNFCCCRCGNVYWGLFKEITWKGLLHNPVIVLSDLRFYVRRSLIRFQLMITNLVQRFSSPYYIWSKSTACSLTSCFPQPLIFQSFQTQSPIKRIKILWFWQSVKKRETNRTRERDLLLCLMLPSIKLTVERCCY